MTRVALALGVAGQVGPRRYRPLQSRPLQPWHHLGQVTYHDPPVNAPDTYPPIWQHPEGPSNMEVGLCSRDSSARWEDGRELGTRPVSEEGQAQGSGLHPNSSQLERGCGWPRLRGSGDVRVSGQNLPSSQMPYPVGRGDGLPRLLAKVGPQHGR